MVFTRKKLSLWIKKYKQRKGCYRLEIFGVQTNHLYFFAFLGYFLVNIFILFKAQVYYGNYLKCIWIKMKNLHFQSADA